MTTSNDTTETAPSVRFRWPLIAIAIVFGLVFAFYLFESISRSLQLGEYLAGQNPILKKAGHLELVYPWVAVVPLLLLPIVTYVLAILIGLRRRALVLVALFVMGLAVLSAGSLTLQSIASQLTRIT
jgi:hypothetical protein